jgi:hypothetical protein
MKATLEFNLDEEKIEYDTMMKGGDYYAALCDIGSLIKLFDDKFECLADEKAVNLYEEFRTAFWEAVTDRNIEL